jgi:hypothetical protein
LLFSFLGWSVSFVISFIRHLQHNPATSMTTLAVLVSLLGFTKKKSLPDNRSELTLINQASQSL